MTILPDSFRQKMYVALFVCFIAEAIDLEQKNFIFDFLKFLILATLIKKRLVSSTKFCCLAIAQTKSNCQCSRTLQILKHSEFLQSIVNLFPLNHTPTGGNI